MLNAVRQTDLQRSSGFHAHTNRNFDPHRDGDVLIEWNADPHRDSDVDRDADSDSNCDADRDAHVRIMGGQLRRQCN
jgi:hypothetical protein